MSLNASLNSFETIALTGRLITEVRKRPVLYIKTQNELNDDGIIKMRVWDEICATLLQGWDHLSPNDKVFNRSELQRLWKNISEHFLKELPAQQVMKSSGYPPKKRTKYLFFDQLQFLLPSNQQGIASGNALPPTASAEYSADRAIMPTTKTELRASSSTNTAPKKYPNYKDILLNILLEIRKQEVIDEDESFAKMLIPMFKNLNDEQKHFARANILEVINRARFFGVQQFPYPQIYPPSQPSGYGPSNPPINIPQQASVNDSMMPSTSRGRTNSENIVSYIESFANELLTDSSTKPKARK